MSNNDDNDDDDDADDDRVDLFLPRDMNSTNERTRRIIPLTRKIAGTCKQAIAHGLRFGVTDGRHYIHTTFIAVSPPH